MGPWANTNELNLFAEMGLTCHAVLISLVV